MPCYFLFGTNIIRVKCNMLFFCCTGLWWKEFAVLLIIYQRVLVYFADFDWFWSCIEIIQRFHNAMSDNVRMAAGIFIINRANMGFVFKNPTKSSLWDQSIDGARASDAIWVAKILISLAILCLINSRLYWISLPQLWRHDMERLSTLLAFCEENALLNSWFSSRKSIELEL